MVLRWHLAYDLCFVSPTFSVLNFALKTISATVQDNVVRNRGLPVSDVEARQCASGVSSGRALWSAVRQRHFAYLMTLRKVFAHIGRRI